MLAGCCVALMLGVCCALKGGDWGKNVWCKDAWLHLAWRKRVSSFLEMLVVLYGSPVASPLEAVLLEELAADVGGVYLVMEVL